MHEIDARFFDKIGYSKESLVIWGFKSYDDDDGRWYVSTSDAREFCAAIGADPALAEI
jgi:hypothetical protein